MFESILGKVQYYPDNANAIPRNRLFGQFHGPQTEAMKIEILQQLTSSTSTIRIVLATVAIGMGVYIPSIRQIIHIGPPRTIQQLFQETGRAGRDGKPSKAVLYYNNRDIQKNKPGMQEAVRNYCKCVGSCLRVELLRYLDVETPVPIQPRHNCCMGVHYGKD